MTDTMQRDIAEIERQRDAFTRLDRISSVERELAVLKTRFEAAVDTLIKELERSVSAEDLKELKREMETALRDAMNGIREHLTAANEQQSDRLLGQVQLMLSQGREATKAAAESARLAAAEDAKQMRRQMFMVLFASVLSFVGAMIMFWFQTRGS